MAASITYVVTNQDMDRALAAVSAEIVQAATMIKQTFDYLYAVVTPANHAAGVLVALGGPEAAPWSQELFDHYSYNVAQLNSLLQALTTGSPPPIEVVQPWSGQFR